MRLGLEDGDVLGVHPSCGPGAYVFLLRRTTCGLVRMLDFRWWPRPQPLRVLYSRGMASLIAAAPSDTDADITCQGKATWPAGHTLCYGTAHGQEAIVTGNGAKEEAFLEGLAWTAGNRHERESAITA